MFICRWYGDDSDDRRPLFQNSLLKKFPQPLSDRLWEIFGEWYHNCLPLLLSFLATGWQFERRSGDSVLHRLAWVRTGQRSEKSEIAPPAVHLCDTDNLIIALCSFLHRITLVTRPDGFKEIVGWRRKQLWQLAFCMNGGCRFERADSTELNGQW